MLHSKKGRKEDGGGRGEGGRGLAANLRAPLKPILFFGVFFFACVVVVFLRFVGAGGGGGGVNC